MVPCHRSMCCHGTMSQIDVLSWYYVTDQCVVMVPCHRSVCCHGTLSQIRVLSWYPVRDLCCPDTLSQINVLSWYLNTYQCVVMVPCHRSACFHGTLSQRYGFIKLYDSICTRNYFSRFQNRTVTADLSQTPDACYRKLNFELSSWQSSSTKSNRLSKSQYQIQPSDQALIKL